MARQRWSRSTRRQRHPADLKRGGRPGAELGDEESQRGFNGVQKPPQIVGGADIGGVAGGERRAVIGEGEHPMSLPQQGAGEPPMGRGIGALRRQRGAFQYPGPRQDGAGPQRARRPGGEAVIDMPPERRGKPGEAAREWDLQHPVVGAEPVRAIRAAMEIRTVIGAEIGVRHDAEINLIAEIVQDLRRRGADAVAAGLVDDRPRAEGGGDGSGQRLDLAALQSRFEIAGIGIACVHRLVMREG